MNSGPVVGALTVCVPNDSPGCAIGYTDIRTPEMVDCQQKNPEHVLQHVLFADFERHLLAPIGHR